MRLLWQLLAVPMSSQFVVRLFLVILFQVSILQTADYVEQNISNIGNNVEQNFAFHPNMGRVRQRQVLKQLVKSYYKPIKSSALPIQIPKVRQSYVDPTEIGAVSSSLEEEGLGEGIGVGGSPVDGLNKRKPSLSQIVYLLRNHRNPFPAALTRAKVIMSGGGVSGVSGIVTLKQMKNGPVLIFGNLQGFPRQGKFGMHFHEYPVENGDCESAGEHFNPYGQVHGGKDSGIRHTGDLGNVVSQYSGTAHLSLTDARISIGRGLNSVLGRSLVIHEYEDDLGQGGSRESLRTGSTGGRISCGTVILIPPRLDAENKPNR